MSGPFQPRISFSFMIDKRFVNSAESFDVFEVALTVNPSIYCLFKRSPSLFSLLQWSLVKARVVSSHFFYNDLWQSLIVWYLIMGCVYMWVCVWSFKYVKSGKNMCPFCGQQEHVICSDHLKFLSHNKIGLNYHAESLSRSSTIV